MHDISAEGHLNSLEELEQALQKLSREVWRDRSGLRVIMACDVVGRNLRLAVWLFGRTLNLQVVLAANTPPYNAAAIALTICSINEVLPLPGFGFDHDNGMIQFRISMPIPSIGIETDLLSSLVSTCLGTVEDYADHLLQVACGSPVLPEPSLLPTGTRDEPASSERYRRNAAYQSVHVHSSVSPSRAHRSSEQEDDATA